MGPYLSTQQNSYQSYSSYMHQLYTIGLYHALLLLCPRSIISINSLALASTKVMSYYLIKLSNKVGGESST